MVDGMEDIVKLLWPFIVMAIFIYAIVEMATDPLHYIIFGIFAIGSLIAGILNIVHN